MIEYSQKPHVVNEARRRLIHEMRTKFPRESRAHIVIMVDWMIDNAWISSRYYGEVEKAMEKVKL